MLNQDSHKAKDDTKCRPAATPNTSLQLGNKMAMNKALRMENPYDFEKFVAIQCREMGYNFFMPEANQKWYDIILQRGEEKLLSKLKITKQSRIFHNCGSFSRFWSYPLPTALRLAGLSAQAASANQP